MVFGNVFSLHNADNNNACDGHKRRNDAVVRCKRLIGLRCAMRGLFSSFSISVLYACCVRYIVHISKHAVIDVKGAVSYMGWLYVCTTLHAVREKLSSTHIRNEADKWHVCWVFFRTAIYNIFIYTERIDICIFLVCASKLACVWGRGSKKKRNWEKWFYFSSIRTARDEINLANFVNENLRDINWMMMRCASILFFLYFKFCVGLFFFVHPLYAFIINNQISQNICAQEHKKSLWIKI